MVSIHLVLLVVSFVSVDLLAALLAIALAIVLVLVLVLVFVFVLVLVLATSASLVAKHVTERLFENEEERPYRMENEKNDCLIRMNEKVKIDDGIEERFEWNLAKKMNNDMKKQHEEVLHNTKPRKMVVRA